MSEPLKKLLETLNDKITVNAINGKGEAVVALVEFREAIIPQIERDAAKNTSAVIWHNPEDRLPNRYSETLTWIKDPRRQPYAEATSHFFPDSMNWKDGNGYLFTPDLWAEIPTPEGEE